MTKLSPVSESVRENIARLADRKLTAEEWQVGEAIPLTPDEIEHTRALVHWFRRRYPTPADRLAYLRRAYARWRRSAQPR